MKELDYLDREGDLLQEKYAGQWVAIVGDAVVAHGSSLHEVVGQAEKEGHAHPLVLKIPSLQFENLVIMALGN